MFNNIENLKIVSSFHRESKTHDKIENRKTHTFIISSAGPVIYDFDDKIISLNQGEMIFLPKGISYKCKTLSDKPIIYTSINFLGDLINPEPFWYSLENFYEADYISNHFSDLWNLGTPAEKYKCISLFYSLLSHISAIENSSYPQKRKFGIIEPAVSYLKEHIYDCSLKTDHLHRLCGISNTYFRQIFIARFGTTPQKYIISTRLSHAKSIVDSGDFNTIGEVALSVGFNDPLYFGKVFKKVYGISPSAINKV